MNQQELARAYLQWRQEQEYIRQQQIEQARQAALQQQAAAQAARQAQQQGSAIPPGAPILLGFGNRGIRFRRR